MDEVPVYRKWFNTQAMKTLYYSSTTIAVTILILLTYVFAVDSSRPNIAVILADDLNESS